MINIGVFCMMHCLCIVSKSLCIRGERAFVHGIASFWPILGETMTYVLHSISFNMILRGLGKTNRHLLLIILSAVNGKISPKNLRDLVRRCRGTVVHSLDS